MIAGIICYSIIGLVTGSIFSLLFINFDSSWKKIVSSLFSFGGVGGFIVAADYFFEIKSQSMKFWTASFLYIMFIASFVLMMSIMCILIKDKDDADILRIRDILLGQKSYIDKYYEKREREIDTILGIPILEQREREIEIKEKALVEREEFLDAEQKKIDSLGKRRVTISLPEKRNIVVTKEFMKSIPSYIGDFSKCINDIKNNTDLFIKVDIEKNNLHKLKTYLLSIAIYISQHMFGGNNDIRVHFRYYNENTEKFEKLVSVIGINVDSKKMTSIPYEGSMIKKSYECKRALIKSINSEYDYQSNNYTKWQDYMTFSFYNLQRNNLPYLTFGISIKNASRYKELFYFLGFVGLDMYLNDFIENIDQKVGFEKILYEEVDKIS